jgi:hypothetical protein
MPTVMNCRNKIDILNWRWKEPRLRRLQIVEGLFDLKAWPHAENIILQERGNLF